MSNYDFEFTSNDDRLNDLEARIEALEQENIGTTNALYEVMNRLDMVERELESNQKK